VDPFWEITSSQKNLQEEIVDEAFGVFKKSA